MSLSIYFCAEVERNGKWYPLIWNHKPIKGEHDDYDDPLVVGDTETHYVLYDDNAYDYDALWREMHSSDGFPDDMSEELKAYYKNRNTNIGYFYLSDMARYLNDAEEEMVNDILSSRDYQLITHLNRIEKAVLKKPVKIPIDEDMCTMSIKLIYENYCRNTFGMKRLYEIVWFMANAFCSYPSPKTSDVRVSFYTY